MSLTCYRYWSMSQILEAIINEASQRVAQLKASGALHPEPHPYVRVVLNDFEYGEKGPGYSRAQWGSFEKEIWWGSALESASTVVEEHVDAAVAALPPALRDHPDARMGVVRLFQNVAFQVLEGKEWSGEEVREHIALLARSLRGEPVCVTVEADLGGVAVLTAPIELKVNGTRIRLRALTREDIEEEQPLEFQSLSKGRLSCHTSAILQLEYQAVDTSAWQRELNRAVAVLRLFGTGNVGYTVFRYRSESLLSISGGMASVDDGSGQRRTYAIREEDLDRLRRFGR